MTGHSSMSIMSESSLDSPSFTSSPLRRRSVFQKPVANSNLLENDDEAERSARHKLMSDTSSATSSISRRSLGLSSLGQIPTAHMVECISQCIKLGAENKINLKNAFSFEMIDFMTYMIKKRDVNMSNLQVASTSLDVSTKIYGFRVDGVHMEILKLVSGLEKQKEKGDKNQNNVLEMDCQVEPANNQAENVKKKKMKKKQEIFSTVEDLRTDIKTEKPSLITMEADLQTTDMLYQVLLPNHANSRYYPHPHNDVLVDTIESRDIRDKNVIFNIPKTTDFLHMDICPLVHFFDFQSWNADDELENSELEKNTESRFQFDLDSVPSDDERDHSDVNYFNNEEHTEQNVNNCARAANSVENIVDFRNVLSNATTSKSSEYSYVQQNLNIHWAGPSHWKLTNLRKISSNDKVTETCPQAPVKEKKKIELNYHNEVFKSVSDKFVLSKSVKGLNKSVKTEWNEEILTLPPDKQYNIAQANKLYLHPLAIKVTKESATHLSDDIDDYHHLNDNDISIPCSPINNDEYQENRNFVTEDDGVCGTQVPFIGENLVAIPKLTNKTNITYCTRAKKIDMKQLKRSIWACLCSKSNNNVNEKPADKMPERKYFSNVYKAVPNLLSKTNIEALSFPISFVSLLHLANEKTLKITSDSELAELIIEQD